MDQLTRDIDRYVAASPRAWVWVLPLAGLGPDSAGQLDALLDGAERRQRAKFRFARHALAYATAHVLLRWSLSVRWGSPPQAWRFAAGEWGKPSLAPPPEGRDVRVSLSHTDGLVAVGVAEGFDIGVDAEAVKPARDWPGIAEEVFCPAEREQLGHADSGFASPVERFYAFWTLKEALLKAKGLGLNQPPNSFAVDLRTLEVAVPPAIAPAHAWRLECCKPTDEHIVSWAWDAPREAEPPVMCVIENAAEWLRDRTAS